MIKCVIINVIQVCRIQFLKDFADMKKRKLHCDFIFNKRRMRNLNEQLNNCIRKTLKHSENIYRGHY